MEVTGGRVNLEAMYYGSGVVPENWRFAVIVPLYKVKEREMNVRIKEVLAC